MRNVLSAFAVGVMAVAIGALSVNPSLAADNRTPDKRAEDRAASEYRAAMRRSETAYKLGMDLCRRMADKERADCMAQAAADQNRARAHAKARLRSTATAARIGTDKRKADYNGALQWCDGLRGKAKEACVIDAKAKYAQY